MVKKRNYYYINDGLGLFLYGFQMVLFVRFAGVVIRQGVKHRMKFPCDSFAAGIVKYKRLKHGY